MSTAKRLISGTASSWGRILFTIISQVAVVPLYLSHWKVETYGVWLSIQALVYLISIPDFGHQTFLGYEFLKFAKRDPAKLGLYLWSGVGCGIVLSVVQVLLILGFIVTLLVPKMLGISDLHDSRLLHQANMVLLIEGVKWLLCTSMPGLMWRALDGYGCFPRMAWWNLGTSVITTIVPVIAVVFGADLLTASAVGAVAALICCVPPYLDLFRLLKREQIPFVKPSARTAFKNFSYSLILSGKTALENTRQQGVRLIIAAIAGNAGVVAAFSTMRTMSNFALQGLTTVSYPLMPELTRFLHQRDQERMEAGFGTLWVVLIALMAPCVVILQVVIQPLYSAWTRGQLPFDPSLFAILSLCVLVYAVSQPAMAIVVANNLLKTQLVLSIITAVVVIGGILALMPSIGIIAAGIALLAAEVASAFGFKLAAEKWLKANGLAWPQQAFALGINSVLIAALAMACIIAFPAAKWISLVVALTAFGWNLYRYIQVLPEIATGKIRGYMVRVPVLKRAFKPSVGQRI